MYIRIINNCAERKEKMTSTEKKILVTGGAGFIGSELVRQLVLRNHHVIAVDNLVNGKRENVADLPPEKFRLEVADIRDQKCMEQLIKGMDAVFHLACLGVRHSIHSPSENHEINATATLQLLTLAKSAGVGRFVYVSSSEVYGTALQAPMTERHPCFPMTVYGSSKLAGECYARAFYRTYNYPTVMIRPFNTYGPQCHHEGDSGEVIPKFLLRCMADKPMVIFGDGSQTRDFTYVHDTARGIIDIGLSDKAVGLTVNLGSGAEVSINNLAQAVADVAGRKNAHLVHDIPRPGDVLRLYADLSLARELFEFTTEISLTQGLNMLKEWYLSSGVSMDELLACEKVRNWEAPETMSQLS